MNVFARFISLLLVFQWVHATTWRFDSEKDVGIISKHIQEPFLIAELSCESDIPFSQKEFEYLTQIKNGKTINAADLERAIANLFKKNLFEQITLTFNEDIIGKLLQFKLRGTWRFEKMKVTGVWVGKDWYKQHYLLEPGDRFDREKHFHSMIKIKQACMKDGYFNVTTASAFTYNKKTKGVTVHAEINRDRRFVIRKNDVRIYADDKVSPAERMLLEKKLAKKLTRSLSHAKYSKKSIEHHARQLKHDLAQKGFLHTSIDLKEDLFRGRHNINLTWHINIRKKREFIFFGNRFFSSPQLLEQILQFGRSAWIVPASILAHEINQAYRNNGFWDLKVDTRDEEGRSFFEIVEGKRATISRISLHGVNAFAEKKLVRKIFSKIKRHGYFDQKLVDQSFEWLTDFYLKRGFLDMKIMNHAFVPLKDDTYELQVAVDEGKQTIINEMLFPDYEYLRLQGPLHFVNKRKKNWFAYDDALIQEHKLWLSEHFRKKGYLSPSLSHELSTQGENSLLTWHINPGAKATFGKTFITGVSDIAFEKIERELEYRPGDMWDQEKIKRSFIRLKDLHLFDAISFTPLPLDPETESRNVLIKLHKDDPFELRLRGGLEFQHIRQYQTFAGVAYKVGATFMVKNPSNNCDHFRFDADVARSHREVRLKYEYPWLLGVPLDGIAQTYATKYEQPGFIGSKRNLYTFYQHGVLFGAHHKNRYLDAGLNVGFEVMRTTFADDDLKTKEAAIRLARSINFDVRLLDQNVPYFFFEPTIMVDLLDNNLYPTKGSFSLLSLKGMFPTKSQFTDSYFVKLLIEHSWFFPLRDIVAAFRCRFGHIFHRKFCDIMPSERFYLGGSNSVRSYETDLAPPTSLFIEDGKKHVVPRGGKTMLNVNAELRIPVARKAAFVIFQDLGLLGGDSFADFNAKRLVAGSGFGMRYHTPIGPLRFDVAWKWRKEQPEERGFNWVLTFGQAF